MQPNKLHICIVTGEFPGISETFITTKALELRKRGHQITVIKNQNSGQLNASHLDEVKKAGIKVLSFTDIATPKGLLKTALHQPFSMLQSLSFSLSSFKKKYKQRRQMQLLQQHPFDIIHFEFSGLAVTYLDVLNKLKSKTVVSCRGTAEKVKTITQPGRIEKLANLFNVVNAVHCVSEDMAATIAPYCTREKIFVNRPSVNPEIFRRLSEYSSNKTMLQILSIGRFTFQKGYLNGLLAIKELKEKGVAFEWKIVGDGPQFEEVQYHIHALKLQDCVQLPGKQNRNEILALYNNADIFFLPSVYEGIANVCLEAMAMEIPVVATRSGGMEEVIENDIDGLLADVYNSHHMAEQLFRLCNDFEKRKAMGLLARQKILKEFTLQRQTDVFEKKYYKLLYHN